MLKSVLTASVMSAALVSITPALAHYTDRESPSLEKQIAAAHHTVPGHGMMQGSPHGQKLRLGVALGEMTQRQLDAMQLEYGVRITGVRPGSPAAQAGIQTGDIVTDVDGRPAYSPERMQHLVTRASDSTTVTVMRDGQQTRLQASLSGAKNVNDTGRAALGVRIQAMTNDLKEAFGAQAGHGVLVSQVMQESAAGEAGIKAGDVIVRIGDADIAGVRDVHRILGGYGPGDEVIITLLRDRQSQTLSVALGSAPAARQAQAMAPHGMHGHGYKHGHGSAYRHGYGHHGYGKKHGCQMGKSLRPS